LTARNPEDMVEWVAIGEGRHEPDHAMLHLELRDPETPPNGLASFHGECDDG
jgi:hypothetical protein